MTEVKNEAKRHCKKFPLGLIASPDGEEKKTD